MIETTALRAVGRQMELWSDRLVGGASAFLISAIMTGYTILWAPAIVLGLAALVLFVLSLVIGGRT